MIFLFTYDDVVSGVQDSRILFWKAHIEIVILELITRSKNTKYINS